MILITKNTGGYENIAFIKAGAVYVNTNQMFYRFRDNKELNLWTDNMWDMDVIKDGVTIILRSPTINDVLFAKASFIGLGWKSDRDSMKLNGSRLKKINTSLELWADDVAIPFYVATGRNALTANAAAIEFPVVYKPADGAHGKGIQLIDNWEQLVNLNHDYTLPMYLQKYIKKVYEYRVITYNHKVVCAARKNNAAKKEFKGRKFVPTNLPDKYANFIRDYSKSGLLGIDICVDEEGKIYIIEQNRAMEFQQMEKVVGNTAELIVKAIKESNNEVI